MHRKAMFALVSVRANIFVEQIKITPDTSVSVRIEQISSHVTSSLAPEVN